jgi:hypothetical protein
MSNRSPLPRGLHRDWRTWATVAVLLLAAAAYVLNLDRVLVPAASPPAATPTVPSKP